jgi:hypothetical protein
VSVTLARPRPKHHLQIVPPKRQQAMEQTQWFVNDSIKEGYAKQKYKL